MTVTNKHAIHQLATQVMSRCAQLAKLSCEPHKISRFYLTPEHKSCNQLVATWMHNAGMQTWEDGAGNCWGRYAAANENAKTLLIGSHLDSIPNAGAYDGILGVLVAIAAVQLFNEHQIRLPFAIEIIGFGDEEGTRFGSTLLGSRAVAGTWQEEWWDLKDRNGISLKDAFIQFGLSPEKIHTAIRARDDLLAYFEVHIEQGPVLEAGNHPLGIVTSIAGARRFSVTIEGYAGHAGTVPMNLRRDALLGAAECALRIEEIAKESGVVATVGRMECLPGAVNVIPGKAIFTVDIRSSDDNLRDSTWQKIYAEIEFICAARNLCCTVKEIHRAPAVACADWIQHLQEKILTEMQLIPIRLMSGAGHDAMAMRELTEVGMLFLRCKGGVSHHPDESVEEGDVALAVEGLVRFLKAVE